MAAIIPGTWQIKESRFDASRQHHHETIFTQGNGYLGTRGTLEERYPHDKQAALVHGFWDDAPIGFTELANVPNWTALEVWIEGHRFSMDNGMASNYSRSLDWRTGVLQRHLQWGVKTKEPLVEMKYERVPSLADPHLMLLRVTIRALKELDSIEIRAMLDSHVENNGLVHLDVVSQKCDGKQANLVVQTRHTHKLLAMSTQLIIHGAGAKQSAYDCPGCPGMLVEGRLVGGQSITVDKFVAIYTSRETETPLDEAVSKAGGAANSGYDVLRKASDEAWKTFWDMSDVVIEGDDDAQAALRHSLFQLRIAAPSYDQRVSIGAKTLSGFGYRGHVFWDTEVFVLPFFTYTQPGLARNMLMYRWHTLPGARRKAGANGFAGAQFAWESAETGDEVTPTWVPDYKDRTKLIRIWTGDIQIHISADIAYALNQYWRISGDDDFWRDVGVPIVLETAVFWGERVEKEGKNYAIRGVIGPDEYHDHVDNNVYTNWMVKWHLDTALEALDWLRIHSPKKYDHNVERLDLSAESLTRWVEIISNLIIHHNEETGLYEQFEGFFKLKEVDWSANEKRTKSMQELLGIESSNRYQVLKQADVIMLMCLQGEHFGPQSWRVNWEYYSPRTDLTYGSSLGPAMHAWAACEVGDPNLAYEHFMNAANADLLDVRGNARDGIHAASAGALWQAAVFGFAGLRIGEDGPKFEPRLPAHWQRLAFNIQYRGKIHNIDVQT